MADRCTAKQQNFLASLFGGKRGRPLSGEGLPGGSTADNVDE